MSRRCAAAGRGSSPSQSLWVCAHGWRDSAHPSVGRKRRRRFTDRNAMDWRYPEYQEINWRPILRLRLPRCGHRLRHIAAVRSSASAPLARDLHAASAKAGAVLVSTYHWPSSVTRHVRSAEIQPRPARAGGSPGTVPGAVGGARLPSGRVAPTGAGGHVRVHIMNHLSERTLNCPASHRRGKSMPPGVIRCIIHLGAVSPVDTARTGVVLRGRRKDVLGRVERCNCSMLSCRRCLLWGIRLFRCGR